MEAGSGGRRAHRQRAGARLRGVLDAIPDAVFVVDEGGWVVWANGEATTIFGHVPEALVGQPVTDGLPRSGDSATVTAVTANGSSRSFELSRSHLDADGEVLTIAVARDVTDRHQAEFALAESEARLKEAQAVAHLGSWHWDMATNVVTWSDELYRIYGLDVESFVPTYEEYVQHVHPDDREMNAEHLHRTVEEGAPYDHEYRVIRPDGTVRWLFTRGEVVRDAEGAPVAMHGTCSDVTERHEAEERYRAVSELMSDVAFGFHVDPDLIATVDWVTGGHERLTGYTVEETHALGWRNLIHPMDRLEYEERIARLDVGDADVSEVRITRKDGGICLARIHVRRVEAPSDGLRFVGAVQDLTERRAAQRQLRESEERYRSVSELTSDVAYAYHLDEDGRHVVDWITEGMERLTGYTVDEAIAMSGWRGMVVPEDRDAYERRLERVLDLEPVNETFRIRAKGGNIRWLEISARSEVDSTGILRVYGAARDVTAHTLTLHALAQSERDLNEAQAVSAVGSWNVNFVTGDRRWSDEMFRLHGLDPDQGPLLVDEYVDLIHPDDREAAAAAGNRGLATGEPYEFEYRVVGDQQPRWLLGRTAPLIVDRELVGLRGTVADITERKLAEQALAESEARLKEAQAVAHLGHWRRDLASGRLEWSDEAYRLLGYEPGSVEPTLDLVVDRIHPDDRAGFEADRAVVVAGHESHEHEFRIILPDGTVRCMYTKARPEHDDTGRVIALVGVSQDVTELRRHDELHRVVSEMVSDVLFSYNVVDGRLHVDWVTPAFERVTGHAVPDRLGVELFSPVLHPEDRPLLKDAEMQVLRGEPQQTDLRVLTPSREVRWLRLYAQPVHDRSGAEVVRVYGAAQDITDQKEVEAALRRAYEAERDAAERLREADRLKDEFISTASHELRTPLTAIVGFSSALARGMATDDETREQIVAKIERNALAVGTMVERLLDFSQLQAGAVHIEAQLVNPSEVTLQTLEILAAHLEHHDVEIDMDSDLRVIADPTALTHVLSNLISNAARYAPAGTAVVVAAEAADGRVELTISDQGPGMTADVAERVFDRFYRGPDQPAGQRGSGIGLSIAKSYVDLMGGTITVETAPGQGTTFQIALPVPDRTPIATRS